MQLSNIIGILWLPILDREVVTHLHRLGGQKICNFHLLEIVANFFGTQPMSPLTQCKCAGSEKPLHQALSMTTSAMLLHLIKHTWLVSIWSGHIWMKITSIHTVCIIACTCMQTNFQYKNYKLPNLHFHKYNVLFISTCLPNVGLFNCLQTTTACVSVQKSPHTNLQAPW